MASAPPTFVCQQCKQPIHLDPSLTEITPESAQEYLPSSSSHYKPQNSAANRLSQLSAPPAVKHAWESAHKQDELRLRPAVATSRDAPKYSSRRTPSMSAASPSGAESFVLLQDSVVRKIPTTPGASSSQPPKTPRKAGIAPAPSKPPTTPKRSQSNAASTSAPISSATKPSVPKFSPPLKTDVAPAPSPSSPARPPISTNNLHSTLRLFTLLSSRTELDHPLCADCTSTLLENLERRLEETKRERDGYLAFERDVRKQREATAAGAGDEKKLEQKIEKLEAEAERAIAELRAAEQDKAQLEAELTALEEEGKALEEEEADFWADQARTQLLQAREQDTLNSLSAAIEHAQHELSVLARTNVYNDAFCIGHDGVFGTVNGLRLGRVSGVNVEWTEINAAWGQTLLLLYTIARKLEFTFETYRLVPMGSFSRIEKISGDKGTYELYGSGDIHLTRILHNRRFDFAMVAFLDCLRQLMEHVKGLDSTVEFPHAVVKDKIGEASIKLQFNQEEVWTRAMRHVLLALKLLLKWATSG